ncbi:hypothetical protein N4G70_29240 [Streptomyces sp. ASQP_92]|nr:hypothetical protein [Streptomyces sp. ASQP_92]MCT9092926.1 hypothetical protein [Streptomyces sp. ASQP_92]
MTFSPWPSIAWTAGLIGLIGFLIVRGQHISAARREAARTAIPHQRQGEQ